MKEKTMPNNIEAERALLGSMFWSYNALQKACESVDSEFFYLDKHAKIFDAMRTLYTKNEPVDITTVTTELVSLNLINVIGGVEYLNDITDSVATGANIEYYIDKVVVEYTRRKMIETATNIVKESQDSTSDITTLIDNAEKNILNISKNRKIQSFRKIQDVLTKVQTDLERLAATKGKLTGIPSGLWDLDNLTSGFHPHQLIIIAARPAVGKSALALNIAVNAAKSTKKAIAIFSLEMPSEQLANRMISSVGQIQGHKLQTGKLENDDWKRVNEAMSQLSETNIYFDDSGSITTGEIKAKCRRLATQGEGLGLVIIDYLQLISSKGQSNNRQQEVSEISRNLKTMAMELEVPVIALSQLSRSVEKREDRRPVLSDLRESGSIEQDADIVAAIHNPSDDIPVDDSPVPIELIILKHRNGPIKNINLLFRKNTSTFLSFKKEEAKQ